MDRLERLLFSAQRSEKFVMGMSDKANVTLFQAICVSLEDMVDALECSKEHVAMLKGLRSKRGCVDLLAHAINPALGETMEPNAALKLAVELRLRKPMISI